MLQKFTNRDMQSEILSLISLPLTYKWTFCGDKFCHILWDKIFQTTKGNNLAITNLESNFSLGNVRLLVKMGIEVGPYGMGHIFGTYYTTLPGSTR